MTREELIELMENTWGEDEEVVDSLLAFFNNDTELIANILENDGSFNRYSCCYDWYDLGVEIINDEAFLADLDSTSYIEMVSAAVDKGEEAVKELGDVVDYEHLDVNENMDKVQEYTIMSVPTVVIDGEVAFIGAPSTEELVEKLKTYITDEEELAKLSIIKYFYTTNCK